MRHPCRLCHAAQCPEIKLAVDHNGTRVAARGNLLTSLIRMEAALRIHTQKREIVKAGCPQLTDSDWRSLREMEAVLAISKLSTTLAQHEKVFIGAYGPLVKLQLLNALKSETCTLQSDSQSDIRVCRLSVPRSSVFSCFALQCPSSTRRR